MQLAKLQKEYERFDKYTHKAYNILYNLYYKIIKDKELNSKKDVSFVLKQFEEYIDNYSNMIMMIDSINFAKIKNKPTQKLNNLLILPLYEDKDIYVNSNDRICDIFE